MSELNFAGESVLEIHLVNSTKGNKLDILGLMISLELYEDLFSNTMSGNLVLAESFNLIADMPIIGEEYVEIKYWTPSMEDIYVEKIFFAYKIRRHVATDKKHVYMLSLISQESVIDLNTKISHAYNGVTSDLATEIYNKHFVSDISFIDTEPSTNSIKFVANYWSPFKCLNYLASRSTLPDSFRSPSFLFFETSQNHKFLSLGNLYKQDPYAEYYYDNNPKRTQLDGLGSQRDIEREMKTAKSVTYDHNHDYIDRIMNGVYSHKVYDFNILRKNVSKKTYNYWYDFEQTDHLEQNPMVSQYVEFDDENGRIEWRTTYPYVHDTMKQDISAEIYSKRIPLLSQTEMYKINLEVPGRCDLEVGDVVIFHQEKNETVNTDEQGKNVDQVDKYYSGKYLVQAIQHRLTQTQHWMTLELMKDSFANEITFKDTM